MTNRTRKTIDKRPIVNELAHSIARSRVLIDCLPKLQSDEALQLYLIANTWNQKYTATTYVWDLAYEVFNLIQTKSLIEVYKSAYIGQAGHEHLVHLCQLYADRNQVLVAEFAEQAQKHAVQDLPKQQV